MQGGPLLALLMAGEIQPSSHVLITDSTRDTVAWMVSDDSVDATLPWR